METSWERRADRWQTMGDRSLLEALRAEEPEALDEFTARFESLVLRYARQLKIPAVDRAHWSAELLYEVAMTLARGLGDPPQHLGAYIAGACRLRARRQRVREAAYEARVSRALDEIGSSGESAVVDLCSESSLRAARGPAWERAMLSPVLERLVSSFEEGITEDERLLLHWLYCQVSYTTIADWLGCKRATVVSRAQRLRSRLIDAAIRFGAQLDRAERLELARFLRRTGRVPQEQILELERSRADRSAQRGSNSPVSSEAARHNMRRKDTGEEPR